MVGVWEYFREKVDSYQVKLINNNQTRHLRGVFWYRKVDMTKDKLSEIRMEKDGSKVEGTVYWDCNIYEPRGQLTEEEYKKSKVEQVKNNLRLPFVATFPSLNLPGSLNRKPKNQRQFQENLLYSDAYLDVTFLKLSVCTFLCKILILGLLYLEIIPFLTYLNLSWLTLLVSWILAFLVLRLVKEFNGWIYHHAVNFSKSKKFENRRSINPYQVVKKFNEGLGLVPLTLGAISRMRTDSSSVQEYLIKEIHQAYKIINKESINIRRVNRLRTRITDWIESRLSNLTSSNLSFNFNNESLVTYNTNFYPIGEGVQYININHDPNLARASLSVLSRNKDPLYSPTLADYESKEGEYNYHGSTNEGTMRQAVLKNVDWRSPFLFFELSDSFGMETSTRVLNLKERMEVVEGSWEDKWSKLPFKKFEDELELRSMKSPYSRDIERMYMPMNFRTSWCMTIPHNRALKNVDSKTEEVLANKDLLDIHYSFMYMRNLMKFLEISEGENRSKRNKTMLVNGIPIRLIKSSEIPEILKINQPDFWGEMCKMVPNLRIDVGQEATYQLNLTEENLIKSLEELEGRGESHYPYFPVELNQKHVVIEFSVITSLIACRDVRRHRTGFGWDHKVLIKELDGKRSLMIHPLYNQPEVSELMNDFPTNLIEEDTVGLVSLSQFPSGALMKLSNHMPFDMVVFLLRTRIQSNLEYGLLFATFYLKLLDVINKLMLGENCKTYLRAALTWNVRKEEVIGRLKEIGLNDNVVSQWSKECDRLLELDDNLKKFNNLSSKG